MNHKFHIFLCVVTAGGWVSIYLFLLIKYKVTGSTISKRAEQKQLHQQWITQRAGINSTLGYIKGEGSTSSTTYILECSHMILAKTEVVSPSYFKGKTVFCETCMEKRVVVDVPLKSSRMWFYSVGS